MRSKSQTGEVMDSAVRRLSVMLDYQFGPGSSRTLPLEGVVLKYSKRSGRVKSAHVDGELFATMRPNGSMAITMLAARVLTRGGAFRANCVAIEDATAEFVVGGRSVFCKFVRRAGRNVGPGSDVVVTNSRGEPLGVGTAVMAGKHMASFKSGAAVKVREGLPR